MNEITKELIFQINTKTKLKPIVYFARDAERALGLESLLDNYYIACVEKSYISEQFEKQYPDRIFCAEARGIILKNKSTLDLVNNPELAAWLKKIAPNNEFYAQLFQFNNPTYLKLEKLGATILNNKAALNRLYEDKLSQFKILSENNIPLPKSEVADLAQSSYELLASSIGNKFVIQLDRAHTGLGTFIIESATDYSEFKKNYDGNTVRISEFIEGEPYTLNACITKNDVYVAGLQYQITGYSELTPGKGSTVGNDFSFGNQISNDLKKVIYETVKKIGKIMQANGYRGLFGIDLIAKGSEIFIIEINARQTANISLQTKLETSQDQVPLLILHLAEFLDLEMNFNLLPEIQPLEGAQIFLRAKNDNFVVGGNLFSGIYRLQSDNSALKWSYSKIKMIFKGVKPKVIFIDEDKDKPLIWQNEGYSIDQITEGGFVLLLQNKAATKNKFEEVARMQFKNQIVYNNKVSPWILEALTAVESQLHAPSNA